MTIEAGERVYRVDGVAAGRLAAPVRRGDGFARYEGRITRSGIFRYRQPDGSIRVEYRPADEVAKALPSLKLVPVTDGHPPERVLTAENAQRHQRGTTGETFRMDGHWVVGTVAVTDSALAKRTDAGESGVSAGLTCRVVPETGTHEGVAYAAVHRDINFNHTALLDSKRGLVPRAGDECQVRIDSYEITEPGEPRQDGTNMVKRTICGKEVEVTEEVAARLDAVDAELAAEKAKADAARGALALVTKDAEAARNDAKSADARANADIEKRAAELAATREKARTILGPDVKLDGLSVLDIKRSVIAKRMPDVKLDGETEAFINGAFVAATRNDAAAEMGPVVRGGPGGDPARGTSRAGEARLDAEDVTDGRSFAAFVAQQRRAELGAWRQPINNSAPDRAE